MIYIYCIFIYDHWKLKWLLLNLRRILCTTTAIAEYAGNFEILVSWNRMLNSVRLVESHYFDNLGKSNLLQLNRIYIAIFYE